MVARARSVKAVIQALPATGSQAAPATLATLGEDEEEEMGYQRAFNEFYGGEEEHGEGMEKGLETKRTTGRVV